MGKHILILSPRLDISFKSRRIERPKGKIPPIRVHWKNLIQCIENEHANRGDDVMVKELPLRMFTPALVNEIHPDIAYIPHKQNFEFKVNSDIQPRYYMQMVFPWLFQIDPKGWGPTSSIHPIQPINTTDFSVFVSLKKRQLSGKSKFDQPTGSWAEKNYVLFTCQLPHDQSIKFHGDGVSVLDGLRMTAQYCRDRKKKLVIRGHPAGKSSMTPLKAEFPEHKFIWADTVNINDLISGCELLITVGSGTGMEAILHEKPVVIFGTADYQSVVNKCTPSNFYDVIDNAGYDLKKYKQFIANYINVMYDTTSPSSFNKL